MADETQQGDPAHPGEPTTSVAAEPKTFTQEEVNRILAERLARAERKPPADYEDLKAKAAKLQEIEDSQKSEAEKLTAKLAEAESRATKAVDDARKAKRESLVVKTAASTANDPLDANILAATAGIDPDAEDADQQIKEKIEALKQSKPYLFKATGTGLAAFNPGQGGVVAETDQQRRDRLQGGGGDPFDHTTAKARGGGVIMNTKGETV